MKKWRTKAFAAAITITMIMSGCGAGNTGKEVASRTDNEKAEAATEETATETEQDNEVASVQDGDLSVEQIKKKYAKEGAEEESNYLAPMYNVEQDKEFVFDFNKNLDDADVDVFEDFVTVHTDRKCEEASKICVYETVNEKDSGSTVTIAPVEPILETEAGHSDAWDNDHGTWGNAPMFYIAIHYDTESNTLKKLDKPTIIPFTVKSEIEVPNAKGVVDNYGNFKLAWDPVEGATQYNIYSYGENVSTGENNDPVKGSEIGYSEPIIMIDSTDKTEYQGFAGGEYSRTNNTSAPEERDYNSGQNFCVCGEYYVSAVVNGKESGFGLGVSTAGLQLPYMLTDESDNLLCTYFNHLDELPKEVEVRNIDGSISKRNLLYKLVSTDGATVNYSCEAEGTDLIYCINLSHEDGVDYPETIGKASNAGNSVPNSNINKAPNDVKQDKNANDDKKDESVEEGKKEKKDSIEEGKEEKKEDSIEEDDQNGDAKEDAETDDQKKKEDNQGKSVVEEQKTITDEEVEQSNKNTVKGDKNAIVFADSAAEEWIALNMINGNQEISMEAFPELQDPTVLKDTMYKVYYQNPYALGMSCFGYDYDRNELLIDYLYSPEEIAEKDSEITKEANEIISQIIKNGMSDEEKRMAIYNYLEDNCSYDEAALENAEQNNFQKTDAAYEDSFNTYGIIVNKKGVCQSYAYAYKLLCSMCGVESKVMTGYLNGNLPHAWNVVNIDGQWYQVDATNNGKTSGIDYLLYNSDSETAYQTGFTNDDLFDTDDNLTTYESTGDEYEYYSANNMAADSMEKYGEILDHVLTEDSDKICVRFKEDNVDQDSLVSTVRDVYSRHGLEGKLETLGSAITNGYIVLAQQK